MTTDDTNTFVGTEVMTLAKIFFAEKKIFLASCLSCWYNTMEQTQNYFSPYTFTHIHIFDHFPAKICVNVCWDSAKSGGHGPTCEEAFSHYTNEKSVFSNLPVNCGIVAWHRAFVKNIPVSTGQKKLCQPYHDDFRFQNPTASPVKNTVARPGVPWSLSPQHSPRPFCCLFLLDS